MTRRRKRLTRKRKMGLAVLVSLVGTAALVGLTLWLAGTRDTDLDDPTAGLSSRYKAVDLTNAPPVRFADVAEAMGVTARHGPGQRGRTLPEDTGSGIAWGDVDGDGDVDLYVVGFPGRLSGEAPQDGVSRLFRNDGHTFTDVTETAGVSNAGGFGMGASFADYDADGDLDLYVTNFGPNRLFRNRGDGTFEEVGEAAGVACPRWGTGIAWGDVDRDGHLDLYVCNYVRYDAVDVGSAISVATGGGAYQVPFTLNPNSFDPEPNRMYLNRGDGTFEDAAERLRVHDRNGRSLGATLCDLDGDGLLDIYVNNDVSTNKLFQNLGMKDGRLRFLDLSTISGTADPRGSMGLSVGEIGGMTGDPDGLPDLFIAHWVAQENALYQSLRTPGGGLEYRDRTRQLRLGEISIDTVGWGSAMVDFDLDGRVDIVVANGSTLEDKRDPTHLVPEPLFLFWNDGKHFVNLSSLAGDAASGTHNARGLAAADFDGDGDTDLAIATNRGRPLLLRNETETGNGSLTVRLDGRPAACFGARVEIVVDGTSQFRWVGGDVGFLGCHGPDLVFGLGTAKQVEYVRVRWADGHTTSRAGVGPGRVVLRPDE